MIMENKPADSSRDLFLTDLNAAAAGAAAVTPTTSSSSSGSMPPGRKSDAGLADRRTHSSELPLGGPADARTSRPRHRRSGSGALFYSSSSATSAPVTGQPLPAGNICPSGKIGRSRSSSSARSDVLGSGSGNYGHGSVVRGGGGGVQIGAVSGVERAMASSDPEEVKAIGNEQYRRGQFAEALKIYDRAISMCPHNAAYRTNRAASLAGLKRLGDAVKECLEALKIDPGFSRSHQRLASLYLR